MLALLQMLRNVAIYCQINEENRKLLSEKIPKWQLCTCSRDCPYEQWFSGAPDNQNFIARSSTANQNCLYGQWLPVESPV